MPNRKYLRLHFDGLELEVSDFLLEKVPLVHQPVDLELALGNGLAKIVDGRLSHGSTT
jgi:hypothetical protein